MRRFPVVLGTVVATLWVAEPASAFAHNRVSNSALHTVLDLLTLGVVTAPLWTAYLWGIERRRLLLSLVALIQLPVAVIAFVPIVHPVVHMLSMTTALALTAAGVAYVRRAATSPAPAPAPAPESP